MTKFDCNDATLCVIKKRHLLTQLDTPRQTWHITLDLKGGNVAFEPGDSVGIYAQNDPILVSQFVDAMGYPSDTPVTPKRTRETLPLARFLAERANLSRPTASLLSLISTCKPSPQLERLLTDKQALKAHLEKNGVLGLLRSCREAPIPLQELIDRFAPLLPRFYSAASCPRTHPRTLDLTVALSTWVQGGRLHRGLASHFLCHLAEIGRTPIPLFVQPAPHFRLPQDPTVPIIMIGPGTGIAPFRAFLQARQLQGASGKHWLFFGERSRSTDFFYQEEWATYPNLRVETAFSRDQEEKVYVQHKLQRHADELFAWLEGGACMYVCGDAKAMAKDVEQTLIEILAPRLKTDRKSAQAHLRQLRKQGRYLRDVY